MTVNADILADRRRLKRRASLWRFLAVVAVVIVLVAGGSSSMPLTSGFWFGRDQIARIVISGAIFDDSDQRERLKKIAQDDSVKALILDINSPGGTTTGAEALFASIRQVAARKPVVAVLGTVAASGGYAAALGADYIVARGNTITGSIGVIMQWAEVKDLMAKVGVRMEEIKSSPLKAQPSPFNTASADVRAAIESMVQDSYEWFVDLVADRRPFDKAKARRLADGRVYSGRQAKKLKLVDAIGGEDVAIAWLVKEKNVSSELKVIDWTSSQFDDLDLGAMIALKIARSLGLSTVAAALGLNGKQLGAERVRLDGLVSVWHPQ